MKIRDIMYGSICAFLATSLGVGGLSCNKDNNHRYNTELGAAVSLASAIGAGDKERVITANAARSDKEAKVLRKWVYQTDDLIAMQKQFRLFGVDYSALEDSMEVLSGDGNWDVGEKVDAVVRLRAKNGYVRIGLVNLNGEWKSVGLRYNYR